MDLVIEEIEKTPSKLYYEKNKDKIITRNKAYREKNAEILKEKSKNYWENKKEMIKQRRHEKVHCLLCGYEVTRESYGRHKKSLTHLENLQKEENNNIVVNI